MIGYLPWRWIQITLMPHNERGWKRHQKVKGNIHLLHCVIKSGDKRKGWWIFSTQGVQGRQLCFNNSLLVICYRGNGSAFISSFTWLICLVFSPIKCIFRLFVFFFLFLKILKHFQYPTLFWFQEYLFINYVECLHHCLDFKNKYLNVPPSLAYSQKHFFKNFKKKKKKLFAQ